MTLHHALHALHALGLAAAISMSFAAPKPAHAQHCEMIGCTVDCRPVPGGRHCERQCTRRCWRPPAYLERPSQQPGYVASSTRMSPARAVPPEEILLGIIIAGVALVVTVFVFIDPTDDAVNGDTESLQMQALIDKLNNDAREADKHIERYLAHLRQRQGDGHG